MLAWFVPRPLLAEPDGKNALNCRVRLPLEKLAAPLYPKMYIIDSTGAWEYQC